MTITDKMISSATDLAHATILAKIGDQGWSAAIERRAYYDAIGQRGICPLHDVVDVNVHVDEAVTRVCGVPFTDAESEPEWRHDFSNRVGSALTNRLRSSQTVWPLGEPVALHDLDHLIRKTSDARDNLVLVYARDLLERSWALLKDYSSTPDDELIRGLREFHEND